MPQSLNATFTADFSELQRAAASAEVHIQTFEKTALKAAREVSKLASSFSGAEIRKEAELAIRAVDSIGGVVKLTESEQKRLIATVQEANDKYRALGIDAPDNIKKITKELEGTVAAQKKAAEETERAQQQMIQNLRGVGQGLQSAGAVLTTAVSAPIIAGFALSIKSAKDFETAFADVVKTVDGLDVDNFGKLNKQASILRGEIIELSKVIPVTAVELSKIASIGGQFGVSNQGLLAFTETVAKLGVAVDGISAEEAAQSLAQIGKIAGIAETEFSNLASAVVELGNNGTSTEASILAMSTRFASAGSLAGLTASEIVGVSAALANLGVEAEAGGSALSKTFGEIGAAVAKGGDDLKGFAEVARVSSTEFAAVWKRSAVEGFDLFLKGLREAQTEGKNMTVILEELGIKELRQSNAIRVLALDQEKFADTVRMSSDAYRENTALTEEARKKFATFENQLQLAKNEITAIGIALGGPMLEALRDLLSASKPVLEVVADLAKWFADLPKPIQQAILALGLGVGLSGILVLLSGKLLTATADVLEFVKALKALNAAEGAANAVGALGGTVGRVLPMLGKGGLFAALAGITVVSADAAAGVETFSNRLYSGLTPLGMFIKTGRDAIAVIQAIAGVAETMPALPQPPKLDQANYKEDFDAFKAMLSDTYASTYDLKQKLSGDLAATGDAAASFAAKFAQDMAAVGRAGFQKAAEEVKLYGSSVKEAAEHAGIAESSLNRFMRETQNTGKAAKDAKKEYDDLAKSLESLGIVTGKGVNDKLDEFHKLITAAASAGVPLEKVVRALWPEFEKLAKQAKASGVGLEEVAGYMQAVGEAGGFIIKAGRDFKDLSLTIPTVTSDTEGLARATRDAAGDQDRLTAAFKAFGQETPVQLRAAADAAAKNYQILKDSGLATTAQLKDAYKQMIEAQREATGQLPSFWEKEVVPRITGTLGTLTDAIHGSFAQMLLGAKGFKDGFVDIWESIKSSVTRILADLLDYFTSSFLKGIISGLSGSQGGWGQAFGSAFGGGVTGGGGGTVTDTLTQQGVKWGLKALGVGGSAGVATAVPGITATTAAYSAGVPTVGIVGAANAGSAGAAGAGAGAGGTFGGLSVAGVLGGAAAGGAGLGLGFLGQEIFGGAGWKAAGFGAGTGAAAGAAIGSVVPGIGTGIGAGVGALAGLIGGWIGQSVGEKVNDARDEFFKQFGASGTGDGSAFNTLSTDLAKLTGVDGRKLFADLIKADDFKELNAAVKAIVETLHGTEYSTIKVREGFEALSSERERMLSLGADEKLVLEQQAGSYSLLLDTIKKTGAEIPAALVPTLNTLIEMGALVDENGEKVTTLADVAFMRLQGTLDEIGTRGADAIAEVSTQLDEFIKMGLLSEEQAQSVRDALVELQDGTDAVEDSAAALDELGEKGLISKERAAKLKDELMKQEDVRRAIGESAGAVDGLGDSLGGATDQALGLNAALLAAARAVQEYEAAVANMPSPNVGGNADWNGPSFAKGGYGDFGSGTLAMLHGKEWVIPENRTEDVLSMAMRNNPDLFRGGGSHLVMPSGPKEIHVHLETDGREFAHAVVPFIPDVLAMHGVAR